MSITDLEVRKARRTTGREREDRLWLGDVFGRMELPEIKQLAPQLGRSVRTAYEYRQTAKMCTAPIREKLSDSPVLVPYSVLREGSRTNPTGEFRDDEFATLLRLMATTQEAGGNHISVGDYRKALGLGPRVEDFMAPDGTGDALQEYLQQLPDGPERDQQLDALAGELRERLQAHKNVRAVLDAQKMTRQERAQENRRLGLVPDRAAAEETAFGKQLFAISDLVTQVMYRFADLDPTKLADQRNAAAVTAAQASIKVFDEWLGGRFDEAAVPAPHVPAQRHEHRTLTAV